jgi:tetratricopeptide (TPR) repeat protein
MMRNLLTALTIACGFFGVAWAQTGDIRNPDIGDDPQGQMLTDAGISEDPAQKIAIISTFVEKYPTDPNIGYAYFQLLTLNLEAEQYPKAAEAGEKLIGMVPDDVEVRHNAIRAYEGAAAWDKLLPLLVETKALAEKQGDDYANGVVQYVEYSLITSALKVTDANLKLTYLEALNEHYPNGQYAKSPTATDAYVMACQQLGDIERAIPVMEASLAANADNPNEGYIYMMAEHALGKRDDAKAKDLGERLIAVMETKAKPENASPEQWEQQKSMFTAYGHFVLGRLQAMTEDYRGARDHLTQAAGPMEKQGGQPYGTLAYFLGICYVKLDMAGDNIPQATKWMTVAAQTENPFQGEAKKTLAAIKQVQ